jgi:hypothetical protein
MTDFWLGLEALLVGLRDLCILGVGVMEYTLSER